MGDRKNSPHPANQRPALSIVKKQVTEKFLRGRMKAEKTFWRKFIATWKGLYAEASRALTEARAWLNLCKLTKIATEDSEATEEQKRHLVVSLTSIVISQNFASEAMTWLADAFQKQPKLNSIKQTRIQQNVLNHIQKIEKAFDSVKELLGRIGEEMEMCEGRCRDLGVEGDEMIEMARAYRPIKPCQTKELLPVITGLVEDCLGLHNCECLLCQNKNGEYFIKIALRKKEFEARADEVGIEISSAERTTQIPWWRATPQRMLETMLGDTC